MNYRHGLGWKPDSRPTLYKPHHHLVSASAPKLMRPDLTPYRSGSIWQSGVSCCVGSALKFAFQTWSSANGYAQEVLISDLFSYGVGRAEMYADQFPDPDEAPDLEDSGSEPGLLMVGAQKVGVVLEEVWPGPASADFDPARINMRPSPDALIQAYDARGLEFYDVFPPLGGRLRDSVRECMIRANPVIFAMVVDNAFMSNMGHVIQAINTREPGAAGHMMAILDASRDDYLIAANWWSNPSRGISWGDAHGNGKITWDLFESQVRQVLAVKACPLIKKAA